MSHLVTFCLLIRCESVQTEQGLRFSGTRLDPSCEAGAIHPTKSFKICYMPYGSLFWHIHLLPALGRGKYTIRKRTKVCYANTTYGCGGNEVLYVGMKYCVFCLAQIFYCLSFYVFSWVFSSVFLLLFAPPFCFHLSSCLTVRQNSLCKVHLSNGELLYYFSALMHCKIIG